MELILHTLNISEVPSEVRTVAMYGAITS